MTKLNGAETKTLNTIRKAGDAGAPVSKLNLRHLGRLHRRGLIRRIENPSTNGLAIAL